MSIRISVLGAASVSLLSGCMMAGAAWHGGGGHAMGPMAPPGSRTVTEVTRTAEARSGGLTLGLSFATPEWGDAALIDAALSEAGVGREPTSGEVRLSIRTPGGRVDQLDMEPLGLSPGVTHRTRYRFADVGLYQVTAEGRVGSGADVRAVSVTAETEVGGQMRSHDVDWVAPAAVLGGLGMVAMMVLMMGGSVH